jgi:hypothetical protein
MSISVSVTGTLALGWIISTLAGQGAPRIVTIIAVLLAGVVEAVVGNLLYRERAGIANRIRELVIYLIGVYLVLSLLQPGSVTDRFAPGVHHLLPLLLVALCWMVAFVFHNRLRGRELLLRIFAGNHGEKLRRVVLDRQHAMALTVAELGSARKLIGSFFVVLSVVSLIGSFEFMPAGRLVAASGAFVMLVLYGLVSIWVMGALNIFIEEYAANGVGLAVPLRLGRFRGVLVALLVAVVFVTGFVLSRNESILPIEAFQNFFRWLGSLFGRERAPVETPPIEPPPPAPDSAPDVLEQLYGMEPNVPPLWLRLLLTLIRRVVVYSAVMAGLILLFAPIFSPAFRKGVRTLKPKQLVKRFWSMIRTRWRILRHLLRRGFRRRSRRERDERQQQAQVTAGSRSWKPSLRKQRQMNRVVSVFVSVTRWGGRNGVPYGRSLAATEWLRTVASIYPEHYADARLLGTVFCEARFSRHLLSVGRMREYVQAAKRITRSS